METFVRTWKDRIKRKKSISFFSAQTKITLLHIEHLLTECTYLSGHISKSFIHALL